jgi:hypothetical protein
MKTTVTATLCVYTPVQANTLAHVTPDLKVVDTKARRAKKAVSISTSVLKSLARMVPPALIQHPVLAGAMPLFYLDNSDATVRQDLQADSVRLARPLHNINRFAQ